MCMELHSWVYAVAMFLKMEVHRDVHRFIDAFKKYADITHARESLQCSIIGSRESNRETKIQDKTAQTMYSVLEVQMLAGLKQQ